MRTHHRVEGEEYKLSINMFGCLASTRCEECMYGAAEPGGSVTINYGKGGNEISCCVIFILERRSYLRSHDHC